MNSSQFSGTLRVLIAYAAGYIANAGFMSNSDANTVLTGLVTFAVAAYTWYKNRDTGKVKSAADVPGVTIVAPPPMADVLINHDSVVSSADVDLVSNHGSAGK